MWYLFTSTVKVSREMTTGMHLIGLIRMGTIGTQTRLCLASTPYVVDLRSMKAG